MDEPRTIDPNDWRTWPRDGRWLLPPPDATPAYCMVAMQDFSWAVWGFNPNGLRAKHIRNVFRVLKKIDGRWVQISHTRTVDGKQIEIRVRGGCRL